MAVETQEIQERQEQRVEELFLNMGPQHPSTHGVLRIILNIEGETVREAKPVIGYLHRGYEKIAENKNYVQFLPYTDRLDYICAGSNNLAYSLAVEKLLGVEIPPRSQYLRVIIAEMSRISGHLVWLATHALDLGAFTVFIYCFREREKLLDIHESYCGARLTFHALRLGGVCADVNDEVVTRLKQFTDEFPGYVDEYERLLTTNRIWLKRTKGVGIISKEDAIRYGLSGPIARGSGVDWDLRRDKPYSSYDKFEFKVPVFTNGDVYDRYRVRVEEMRQANRIIRQALDNLPEGEIRAKLPRVLKVPAGEAYSSIEAPKGELGFYIISDGSDKPYRLKIRAPSFVNLQALPVMCKGMMVADTVAVIGSLDVVLGEIDR